MVQSADEWDEQAHRLVLERIGERTSLEQVRAGCVDLSEDLRADPEIISFTCPGVLAHT